MSTAQQLTKGDKHSLQGITAVPLHCATFSCCAALAVYGGHQPHMVCQQTPSHVTGKHKSIMVKIHDTANNTKTVFPFYCLSLTFFAVLL